MKRESLQEKIARFWSHFNKLESGCWVWRLSKCGSGNAYGQVSKFCGRRYLAHRLAWELTNGPIPDGLQVLHKCDNPPCGNPDHLFLGTQADNCRDREQKGRGKGIPPYLPGELSNSAKLTNTQVREIRKLCDQGIKRVDIARKFNVSPGNIGFISKRETWRDI